MITIKAAWLYAAIFVAAMTGGGAGYFVAPSDESGELERVRAQLAQFEKRCIQQLKNESFKQAPVTNSPARGF